MVKHSIPEFGILVYDSIDWFSREKNTGQSLGFHGTIYGFLQIFPSTNTLMGDIQSIFEAWSIIYETHMMH